MEAIAVDVRRVGAGAGFGNAARTAPDLETDLRRARVLANWLDARFSLFGVRFGLDAIIGLIPGIGDTLTALAGLYPIFVAERHGLGKSLQFRMGLNVLIDWLPGLVPVFGDLFDVAYKSNLKNLALLEAAVERKRLKSK